MFWICAEDGGGNTEMFLLLLSGTCTELLTPPEETEGAQKLGRDTADPNWLQGIFQTIWHYAQSMKAEGTFGVMAFIFPSNCYVWWSLVLEVAKHLPAHEKWRINSFFFACVHGFCFPVRLSLSQHTSFLTFTSFVLSLIVLAREEERLCGTWLLAGVKAPHLFLYPDIALHLF